MLKRTGNSDWRTAKVTFDEKLFYSIKQFQEEETHTQFTSAIRELCRRGLKAAEKNK